MRISADLMKKHGASKYQVDLFKQFLGKRKYMLTTDKNLRLAAAFGIDTNWLVQCFHLTTHLVIHQVLEYWYENGKLNREDGPALIISNGGKFWYRDDNLHRDDGPACVYADGVEYWYRDGKAILAPK